MSRYRDPNNLNKAPMRVHFDSVGMVRESKLSHSNEWDNVY